MARFCFRVLIVAIFIVEIAISVDPPTVAPSPAPELESNPPSAHAPSHATGAPASSPSDSPFSSPPAPSPDLGPVSPGSSPAPVSSVPAPAPSEREVSHSNVNAGVNDAGSGGMSSGKKAGIAFGVIAAVGLVAGAGCLLKKRRDNERRAQYGFAARREIL